MGLRIRFRQFLCRHRVRLLIWHCIHEPVLTDYERSVLLEYIKSGCRLVVCARCMALLEVEITSRDDTPTFPIRS